MNQQQQEPRPVTLAHNLDPRKFVFLFLKYATGSNPARHCTNSVRGRYSKKLSKHNPDLQRQTTLVLDEQAPGSYEALYLCGVSSRGYRQKANYPHNLHAAIRPAPGASDDFEFDGWRLHVEDGVFVPIPAEVDLPERYRSLPAEYTTCRIFRWAVTHFGDGAGEDAATTTPEN